MINALLLSANKLKSIDIIFFICCIAAVVLAVAIYFLIPVFNKKQYLEQRENLRKREEAFHANKKSMSADAVESCDCDNHECECACEQDVQAQTDCENTDGSIQE